MADRQRPAGQFASIGWEWVNRVPAGGAWMLAAPVHLARPRRMLATLAFLSLCFWDGGSSDRSDRRHIIAFWRDHVRRLLHRDRSCQLGHSLRGRLIFGAGVGALVFVIRAFGNYPDAVAFAVLLMNLAAPFIDQYTRPRTYGHGGAA